MHITHVSLGADRCIKKGCVVNSPQALYVFRLSHHTYAYNQRNATVNPALNHKCRGLSIRNNLLQPEQVKAYRTYDGYHNTHNTTHTTQHNTLHFHGFCTEFFKYSAPPAMVERQAIRTYVKQNPSHQTMVRIGNAK